MKNILKQFAGWGTPSNQSDFKKAVILLTFYYAAGVFGVLIIFNFLVYGLFSNSTHVEEFRIKEQKIIVTELEGLELGDDKNESDDDDGDILDDLAKTLVVSDLIILVLAVFAGYFLSKRTLAPLEAAYRKQSQFVADAAHELRTPLSVMQAGSEVVLRSPRSVDEYTKFIQESLDEVKRLTKLSNDLLFLARNNKKKTNSFAAVNFSEICRRQIENMRAYAETKKVSFTESIEPNVSVPGMKDDLTRLLVNLLKNAIDYNKENGTVVVSLKKMKHGAVLRIEDTGVGIKKDDLQFIFDRFYKVDTSRTENSSSGLGLAIVKEIVEEHHGVTQVQSTHGKGTTFEVILPVA